MGWYSGRTSPFSEVKGEGCDGEELCEGGLRGEEGAAIGM